MTLRHLALAPLLVAGLLVPAEPAAAARAPLRQGMSGTCVLTLQRRLVALRYDLSTPTSGFGAGTFHAVVASEVDVTKQPSKYLRTLLAIHAYSYVPAYPASHGCIRVPPASAARLWTTTYVGERVYTYR